MIARISPSATSGTLKAIASKSAAHRSLICAAFADGDTVLRCEQINEDISATVRCLISLGAKIERDAPFYRITPISSLPDSAVLDCGESGSTMRFLVPVVCMLGINASFVMSGRLPERPLSPLREELERHGITFSAIGSNPLTCRGKADGNEFSIAGNISSQFISGLMFALSVSRRGGLIRIEGKLESAPYIDMTADALRVFGVSIERSDSMIAVASSELHTPSSLPVEGDWSNAAFPLCLGAIGKGAVTVCGIDLDSRQGDKAIVDILRRFGARVELGKNSVTVSHSALHGIDIDASQIPDLVPAIASVASVADGKTVIYNAGRLRIKESDRLTSVRTVMSALGADITETDDGLIINGKNSLTGGAVSSFGDHRIAMSAAVASAVCDAPVIIERAESTAKSYPAFWDDMRSLSMNVTDSDEL